MPLYDYKCRHCNAVESKFLPAPPQETMTGEQCSVSDTLCVLDRVWHSPSIGRVSGGQSPARGPSR